MTLRGIVWLAVLLAIAVALATVGRFDAGQVLIVYPPYRVDVSLNLFVISVVVLFIVVKLRHAGQLEDCLASGRTNCAPIEGTTR